MKNSKLLFWLHLHSIRADALKNLKGAKIGSIYVEVPAAISFNEWEILKNKAEQLNTILYPGYNMRFHPGFKILDSLKSNFLTFRGIFAEYLPSLHLWESYKERYEAKKSLGGGPLLTSHHELDIAIGLFGPVDSVSCFMRNSFLDIDSSDHALINLFHKNGTVSNIDLNFFYKEYTRRIEIASSQELIIYEPFNTGLRIGSQTTSFKNFDFNQTYIDAMQIALNRESHSKSISLDDVDHLLKVTDALFLSSSSNGIIKKLIKKMNNDQFSLNSKTILISGAAGKLAKPLSKTF